MTVSTSSLEEAAARGTAEFKRSGLRGGGPATRLTINVEAPPTSHELPAGKLQFEHGMKVTLRQLLGRR